jgi:predicted enzyme related to lactoylglutathione lyase
MSPFVWFHNHSENPKQTKAFYEQLAGWKAADGPGGMTLFQGEKAPMAGLGAKEDGTAGWLPYLEVDDVGAATKRAVKLGATLVSEKTRGPAGEYSVIRDPGGATVALWQKA